MTNFSLAILLGMANTNSVGDTNDAMETAFFNFVSKYNKSYGTREEYEFRFNIFKNNFVKIEAHNQKHANGLVKHTLKINKKADFRMAGFCSISAFTIEPSGD